LTQPPLGGNCLNWTVGHVHRDEIIRLLGAETVLDGETFDRYNREIPSPVTVPVSSNWPICSRLSTSRRRD